MTSELIRIVIADDSKDFRDGMRFMLEGQEDFTIVGEAANGIDAFAEAMRTEPTVVLMDIQMPGSNGIEATRKLIAARPDIGVLVVTMFDDDESVFSAMRAGARGYLLKGARKEQTLRSIRSVANGEAFFSPGIARRMMTYFPEQRPQQSAFPELTEREREILGLVARGLGNNEIADRLVLSLKTVRNHVTTIVGKLQVADRTQAALVAREAGLAPRDGNPPRPTR